LLRHFEVAGDILAANDITEHRSDRGKRFWRINFKGMRQDGGILVDRVGS
jgi:hypothetical protein